MTPPEAERLYIMAQKVQRSVPGLDISVKHLVMLTAQAVGLRGRSTTTPATVRNKALEILRELDRAKHSTYALLDACTTLETPVDRR